MAEGIGLQGAVREDVDDHDWFNLDQGHLVPIVTEPTGGDGTTAARFSASEPTQSHSGRSAAPT
jgi:hypothetical protein